MYEVKSFAEDRLDVQHAMIEKHPLGLLICTDDNRRPLANPLPFVLRAEQGELGTLLAHMARPNPQWRLLTSGSECLVVFQGEEAYVSPGWYPSKREHGKVVPTWNYISVHVWGRPTVRDDPDWLKAQVDTLTDRQEASSANPWRVDDAPAEFTESMLKGIVGLEIAISEIQGKWKVSQNRPAADIRGVQDGLTAIGETAMAAEIARRAR
ncbi:MAG: FMN-binding negative transcriptional regulator [Pseudomonadota bacterium]